ncbi:MAG: DUF4123 domain-containing protein [Phycisphaerae bacterium]
MDKQKLKENLLNARTRSYCVLDGAAVPDLPKRLYEMDPPNYPLIRGNLTPDMVHVAPYVVFLGPRDDFTNWIIDEGFGKNWGIFVQCRFSINEMRRHFRELMNVNDETGKPLLFRFYDPRVIRKFLPTCDEGQVEAFFGKVERYFVESGEGETMLVYTHENGGLSTTELDLKEREGDS